MNKLDNWQVPVFITFILLGLLITVQFRTQQSYLNDISQQNTEDLVLMLKKLNDKQGKLEKELATLEMQHRTISNDVSTGETLTKELQQENKRQRMALGIVPVEGPGITVTLDANPTIAYYDIIDIINELWNSQAAEAIAINDHRVTAWTKIYWNEQTRALTVDGEKITFPYTIQAIGDPDRMESGLRLMGGVLDNLAIYDIRPTVKQVDRLNLTTATIPDAKYLRAKK